VNAARLLFARRQLPVKTNSQVDNAKDCCQIGATATDVIGLSGIQKMTLKKTVCAMILELIPSTLFFQTQYF